MLVINARLNHIRKSFTMCPLLPYHQGRRSDIYALRILFMPDNVQLECVSSAIVLVRMISLILTFALVVANISRGNVLNYLLLLYTMHRRSAPPFTEQH